MTNSQQKRVERFVSENFYHFSRGDKQMFKTINTLAIAVSLSLLGFTQAQASLLAHWKFDETSGTTAADSSGNGNTGTLTNMPGSEWTTGKVGGGLAFDGVDDYVLTSAIIGPTGTSARTVAMWFATTTSNQAMLQYGGGSFGGNFRMRLDGNDGILTFDPSHANKKLLSPSVNDGAWHHMAITWAGGGNGLDDSTITFFVDGIEYADGTYTGTGSTTTDGTFSVFRPWYTISTDTNHATSVIGAAQSADDVSNVFDHWQGVIDEVRIYDSALTAAQIQALVPEPSTALLLCLGLMALATGRRNR